MTILNALATLTEITTYYNEYVVKATKKYPNKKMIVAFSYKDGKDTRFRAVKCDFADINPFMLTVCEKSNSSRHVDESAEKTYKLRLTNVKNDSVKKANDSFIKRCFNNEVVFDVSADEFFSKWEIFKNMYKNIAPSVIYAKRAKQKKQKKQETTQLNLTIGHFTEWLIIGEKWSINTDTVNNGYDYKDKDGTVYEVKSCYSTVDYNGDKFYFGGSSIEQTKDN